MSYCFQRKFFVQHEYSIIACNCAKPANQILTFFGYIAVVTRNIWDIAIAAIAIEVTSGSLV